MNFRQKEYCTINYIWGISVALYRNIRDQRWIPVNSKAANENTS